MMTPIIAQSRNLKTALLDIRDLTPLEPMQRALEALVERDVSSAAFAIVV